MKYLLILLVLTACGTAPSITMAVIDGVEQECTPIGVIVVDDPLYGCLHKANDFCKDKKKRKLCIKDQKKICKDLFAR